MSIDQKKKQFSLDSNSTPDQRIVFNTMSVGHIKYAEQRIIV